MFPVYFHFFKESFLSCKSFQGFLFAIICIGQRTRRVTPWISQTAKINSITESFWVSRIFVIDSSRSTYYNYSYSFGKQPAAIASLSREMWAITPTILLKKNLTYSSIFKVYFMKSFAAAKASLVFIKSRCRSSRSQMFFKTGVHKNFAMFTGKHLSCSLFLIKLQTFRCFLWILQNCSFFIEHLWWLLL